MKRIMILAVVTALVLALAATVAYADVLWTGTNNADTFAGTANADDADAKDGNDTISGAGNDDDLMGQSGNDELNGNIGADLLIGSIGTDDMDGGNGDDSIVGQSESGGEGGTDTIVCGDGDDFVWKGPADSVAGDCEHVTTTGYFAAAARHHAW